MTCTFNTYINLGNFHISVTWFLLQDPTPLPYLVSKSCHSYDIPLEVWKYFFQCCKKVTFLIDDKITLSFCNSFVFLVVLSKFKAS